MFGRRSRTAARPPDISRGVLFVLLIAAALFPLALQLFGGQQVYWLFIAAKAFTFAIVAISLDLLMGRTGQISLGQNGFLAVGAYTAAILSVRYDIDILTALLAAGAVSGVASLILGFPAARLRGHYLGIVTFGYGIAVSQIALKWDTLTGGDQGLHLHPPRLFGHSVSDPVSIYYFTLVALALVAIATWNLTWTRIGRSFAAVRDSEIAAAAMGVPVARTKILAFVCSAFLAGVAGCLYAFVAGFVAPEDFGVEQALIFFAMVVIGGGDFLLGAILGALIVDAIQQAASTVSGLSLAILGGMITLMALFFPRGLKGVFAWLSRVATKTSHARAIEKSGELLVK
jgi:branched-chain amino acid transport system permease protein